MTDEYLAGMRGRISVPVSKEFPGEIMLDVHGGCEAYTAYSSDGEELKKNTHAVVIEQTGPRTVMVTGTDV